MNNSLSDYTKTLFHIILPKHALTLYAGFWANVTIPFVKNRLIERFIRKHGVNMQEAEYENIDKYTCFNDFFIRHLKPGCRTIDSADIVSPVDGVISEMGNIHRGLLLQAKGRYYSVRELLACDTATADTFDAGSFITLYLSPKDYHRVHMPIEGTLSETLYIPGRFYSVKPALSNAMPNLFSRNQRLVVHFQTAIGRMAMVLVGATIVGRIGTAWQGDIARSRSITKNVYPHSKPMHKGQEMGYFKLGSTVILLFSHEAKFHWHKNAATGKAIQLGEALSSLT